MKIVLEFTPYNGSLYDGEENEKVVYKKAEIQSVRYNDPYNRIDCTFIRHQLYMIEFYKQYMRIIKGFENEDENIDTLIIKTNIMQILKADCMRDLDNFKRDLSHAYKTLKMGGIIRPDEIYYVSDSGEIDKFASTQVWEANDQVFIIK